MESNPVLYILMRNDMESMNPGKGMAQASHAYGAMKKAVRQNHNMQALYRAWMDSTEQEFGTTIVLAGSLAEINTAIADLDERPDACVCGWVHDPTYPLRDGFVTHYIPLDTCAFVFGEKSDVSEYLSFLRIHP